MGLLLGRQSVRDLFLGFVLLCGAATLVIYPQEAIAAMSSGLSLCGNVIIPALFPFLVLSSLVVELGMSRYLGRLLEPVMFPLFRINGTCSTALALGFLGGYPVGAQTAIRLYQSGQCSRTEAERLLAFCNNCGPAFILGVVGAGVFGSSNAGILLYLAHIAASLLVGFLFRWYKPRETPLHSATQHADIQAVRLPQAFTKSIIGALQSSLNICSFILFFAVALEMLSITGVMDFLSGILTLLLTPAGFDNQSARQLLIGLLEMSSGVSSLTYKSSSSQLPIAAFILGWAGLSVHCQVMAFLSGSGLSLRTYLAGKFLHGIFSAALMSLLSRIVPLEFPVSYYLAEQTASADYLEFQHTLSIAAAAAWLVWLLFFLITGYAIKKSSRNLRSSIL